jgi:hypothetical protein
MTRRYGVQTKIVMESEWRAESPEQAITLADKWLQDTYGNINYKANYLVRELPYDET